VYVCNGKDFTENASCSQNQTFIRQLDGNVLSVLWHNIVDTTQRFETFLACSLMQVIGLSSDARELNKGVSKSISPPWMENLEFSAVR